MERFLGTEEHFFWLSDQVVPFHFVLSAKISGNFTLDQLRRSLAQAQMQHPLLRVGIAIAETGYPKFVEQAAPIPFRQVPRENDHCWHREVEIELSRSFDWQIAPLIRVVVLHSERESNLIVTCHHAIADGMSVAYLIRDIVKGLESKETNLNALSQSRPIEQLIPLAERATIPQATLLHNYSTRISSRPRPTIKTALLSSELTQQVCDRARKENTTVHGAICAAFLLAMARQRGPSLKCQSPVNVRSQLTPLVGEMMGLYMSVAWTRHELDESSSLWNIARSLKSQLLESTMPSQTYELIRQLQMQTASLPNAQTFFQEVHQEEDLIVTNLGRLPFGQQFGSLRIEALFGPAALTGGKNEQLVGVATLGNQLSLMVCHPSTTTSETEVTESLEDTLKLLSECNPSTQ
jgi:NRPS condensation-like uncharacterized protein